MTNITHFKDSQKLYANQIVQIRLLDQNNLHTKPIKRNISKHRRDIIMSVSINSSIPQHKKVVTFHGMSFKDYYLLSVLLYSNTQYCRIA